MCLITDACSHPGVIPGRHWGSHDRDVSETTKSHVRTRRRSRRRERRRRRESRPRPAGSGPVAVNWSPGAPPCGETVGEAWRAPSSPSVPRRILRPSPREHVVIGSRSAPRSCVCATVLDRIVDSDRRLPSVRAPTHRPSQLAWPPMPPVRPRGFGVVSPTPDEEAAAIVAAVEAFLQLPAPDGLAASLRLEVQRTLVEPADPAAAPPWT